MDSSLLEDLWSTHLRLFRHIALAIVRRTDIVEDVVQEAFRRALRSSFTLNNRDEALLYLKRIVTNTSIDYYHHRRRQANEQEIEDVDRVADSPSASPLDRLLRREEAETNRERLQGIMEELMKLSEEQREAIEALVLSDPPRTLTEMSRTSGIPISTLRSRLVLGLDRIRKNLRKRGL